MPTQAKRPVRAFPGEGALLLHYVNEVCMGSGNNKKIGGVSINFSIILVAAWLHGGVETRIPCIMQLPTVINTK